MVTWNPQLLEIKKEPGATLVVRFQQDSRRDPRPAGRQHRDAEGQSQSRQGAGRHLVRDHRADAPTGRPRARPRARRWRSCPAPTWPASTRSSRPRIVLRHAGAGGRLHQQRRPADDHGPGAHVQLRARSVRPEGEVARTRSASRFRRQDARRSAKNIKLRFDPTFMTAGRRRQALTPSGAPDAPNRRVWSCGAS